MHSNSSHPAIVIHNSPVTQNTTNLTPTIVILRFHLHILLNQAQAETIPFTNTYLLQKNLISTHHPIPFFHHHSCYSILSNLFKTTFLPSLLSSRFLLPGFHRYILSLYPRPLFCLLHHFSYISPFSLSIPPPKYLNSCMNSNFLHHLTIFSYNHFPVTISLQTEMSSCFINTNFVYYRVCMCPSRRFNLNLRKVLSGA